MSETALLSQEYRKASEFEDLLERALHQIGEPPEVPRDQPDASDERRQLADLLEVLSLVLQPSTTSTTSTSSQGLRRLPTGVIFALDALREHSEGDLAQQLLHTAGELRQTWPKLDAGELEALVAVRAVAVADAADVARRLATR